MDQIKLATKRREDAYKNGKILLTNFKGSLQQHDLDRTKGRVKGAVEDFYRVKANIKPESWQRYQEAGDNKSLLFDFNWWPIPELGLDAERQNPEHWNDVFIYQLKSCNLACPFCFVDRFNNNGRQDHGAEYFFIEEIVDVFEQKRTELGVNVLRASGGEPSLIPEQWLKVLQELERRGLADLVYLTSDTNLLTGSAMEEWRSKGKMNLFVLEDVADYKNFGLLSCFKGTDAGNFKENTGCSVKYFEETFKSFDMFARAGIKIYPHLINPNPETLESFMEKLANTYGEEIIAMVHLFSVGMYEPVQERYQKKGQDPEAVALRWKDNLRQGEEIMDNLMQKHFGLEYKDVSRPEIIEKIYKK